MKFNSELNYFENIEARRNFQRNSDARPDAYKALKTEERSQLMALNEQLKQLEEKFWPIMNAKENELQARVADPADWMQEFNLEIVFTFYLRKDDPEYEEDDDNILMQIDECVFHNDHAWGFGITSIHYCESHDAFKGEHHCHTYHQLYGHCHLNWSDLLRIGNIYVDIKIDEQSNFLLMQLGGTS